MVDTNIMRKYVTYNLLQMLLPHIPCDSEGVRKWGKKGERGKRVPCVNTTRSRYCANQEKTVSFLNFYFLFLVYLFCCKFARKNYVIKKKNQEKKPKKKWFVSKKFIIIVTGIYDVCLQSKVCGHGLPCLLCHQQEIWFWPLQFQLNKMNK